MNDFENKVSFDINDIIKILPHRYPFILIDKIEINEPGKSLTALKNVTINEPFFQGHFPGQPSYARGIIIRGSLSGRFIFDVKSS